MTSNKRYDENISYDVTSMSSMSSVGWCVCVRMHACGLVRECGDSWRDYLLHSSSYALSLNHAICWRVSSFVCHLPIFFLLLIVFPLYESSMFDDNRQHVLRSYISSPDSPFSLTEPPPLSLSPTVKSSSIRHSSLPPPFYFNLHCPPS